MSAEVVDFNLVTGRDCDPGKILELAADAKLKHCMVLGWDDDGTFFMSSSLSTVNAADMVLLCRLAERQILDLLEAD